MILFLSYIYMCEVCVRSFLFHSMIVSQTFKGIFKCWFYLLSRIEPIKKVVPEKQGIVSLYEGFMAE